jgi:Spy/CpxP family protein refolding chaperone
VIGADKEATVKKRTLAIVLTLMAALAVSAVPAIAQETSTVPKRIEKERTWPPDWVGVSLDELKAQVEQRAAARIERIESSARLADEEKADAIDAVNDLLAAVDGADANAEVVGLVVSRTQLERQELRAARRGVTPDYENHLAGDIERANRRLERLTKVMGWAEAAGEDVAEINGYLDEAATQLDNAIGNGTVVERHDSVHIALAWMTQAAVALDAL